MSVYTTSFTDSTADENSDSMAAALGVIAERYGVIADKLVTKERERRTVVWLDAASAEDDDWAKEVAEIREA